MQLGSSSKAIFELTVRRTTFVPGTPYSASWTADIKPLIVYDGLSLVVVRITSYCHDLGRTSTFITTTRASGVTATAVVLILVFFLFVVLIIAFQPVIVLVMEVTIKVTFEVSCVP